MKFEQPISESDNESDNLSQPSPTPVSAEHVRQFLSWMYPQRSPAEFEETSDDVLRSVPAVLAKAFPIAIPAQKHRAGSTATARRARENLRDWLAGETTGQIAAKHGRTDSAIEFALDTIAKKLSTKLELEDILEKAARISQKRARQLGRAAAESASDIVAIELPAETIEELGETDAEATVAKETPAEATEPAPEPPADTKPPLSKYQRKQRLKRPVHQYSDDFRLADRLSPSAREALEEMIKKAGIPPSEKNPRKPDQRRR